MSLCIRGATMLDGTTADIAIRDGTICGIGRGLPRAECEIDALRMTALPGLHDHHLHILATAARRTSVDLSRCAGEDQVIATLRSASSALPQGAPLRAVGFDERTAPLPDRDRLDRWLRDRPLRLQDRTGALWVLNGRSLASLPGEPWPTGAEHDAQGAATGRFWREDSWLGRHWQPQSLDLTTLGAEMARYGLTALTDAGPRNGPGEAATLGGAHASGALPQRLMLMGDETLPEGAHFERGPLKLMIDERDPPAVEALASRIGAARRQYRAVAAHCVTASELALYLAALDAAGGAKPGDRIEHGGMISDSAIEVVAASGLAVVTNPVFVHDRGDRYRVEVPKGEQADLYRAASLVRAGVSLAAGSDSPYGDLDPWLGMRAARDRLTATGHPLGSAERLAADMALNLYVGDARDPGYPARLAVGRPGDLILCEGRPDEILAELTADRVHTTVIAGQVFSRDGAA